MPSREYQKLKERVEALQAKLLDFEKKTTEPYNDTELLKCQAFIVFSHAEIQVYWESVALTILENAEKKWKQSQYLGRVAATLLAFRQPKVRSIPAYIQSSEKGEGFNAIFQNSVELQKETIRQNNGIKHINVGELLFPLGVFPSDLSNPLTILLDQTGKHRGDMVHKSTSVSLRTIRDPFRDELADIEDLIREIGTFDQRLEQLEL